MNVGAGDVEGAGSHVARSPAMERRLRRRRQEARLRLRLLEDATLLASHHASALPSALGASPDAEIRALRSELAALRALVDKLLQATGQPDVAPLGGALRGPQPPGRPDRSWISSDPSRGPSEAHAAAQEPPLLDEVPGPLLRDPDPLPDAPRGHDGEHGEVLQGADVRGPLLGAPHGIHRCFLVLI